MASAESPRAVGVSAARVAEDFPEIRWRGNWVWVPEEPVVPSGGFAAAIDLEAREANGLFRRVFTLDRVPERVPARITADSRYVLHVNGREVGRGPIRSQFRRLQYDLYDLAPYLVVGQNVITVHVKYYGRETAFWMPATPNRTLGRTGALVFECDLGAAGWLVSDESWKARRAAAWDHPEADGREMAAAGVPLEIFDARLLPADWKSAAFDDAGWGQAQVIHAMLSGTYRSQPPTHPYGPLYPRSIGQLGGEVVAPARIEVTALPGHSVRLGASPMDRVDDALAAARAAGPHEGRLPAGFDLPAGGAVWVAIDMGRIVSGLVHLSVDAAPGTEFDLSYTEEPVRVGPTFGRMRAGSRYIARGSDDRFDLFDAIGFRYAYLLVHGESHPVVLREFVVREYLHPWQDIATFECSDPRFEDVFRAGVRTVQLCSPDAFVDCPTREQRAWTGDGVVHQMVTLAANSDWRLAQRYVELGNSPRSDGILPMFTVSLLELTGGFTLPDWSLHWVHGVHNWFRYAGDRGAVLSWMPTVARILRWYAPYQTATGVLRDVGEWNLVDWSSVSTSDTSSLLTAEWARGLREFAEMAAWLGESASRQWAEDLYEWAKAGFEVFWDEARGSYIDHVVDGAPQPEMSQIAGALAIVSGLAPESRWPRIVDTITDEKRLVVRSWSGGGQSEEKFEKMQRGIYEFDWDVQNEIVMSQPFMSYVVHDAVALAGRADRLPDLCLRWTSFLHDGYDTIGENWGLGTHAHGWSCTPARDLLVYTLGVSPAAPGFSRARVAPRLGRLDWAKGQVPTPGGRISVEISRTEVTIESPIGFDLQLEDRPTARFPAGRHTTATASGERARHRPRGRVAMTRNIDELLGEMTLTEKVGQLMLENAFAPIDWMEAGRQRKLADEQGLPYEMPLELSAAIEERVRGGHVTGINSADPRINERLQRIAVEESRLGIPLLVSQDVLHGFRTVFPIPLGAACSWNPDLVERAARVAAVEASTAGVNWFFAPMVDIARDARWGRIAEGAGEDPLLGGEMARAQTRGFQTPHLPTAFRIAACPKHYAGYGAAEAGRDYNTVDMSERTLRDVYLPPFKAAFDAGADSTMSSFNEIGGVPGTCNAFLLSTVLREEWGFAGPVVSDFNAIGELVEHGVARDLKDAVRLSILAGVDMDLDSGGYTKYLPELVEEGAVPLDVLDEAVRRVLRLKLDLGLFDDPFAAPHLHERHVLTEEHRALALELAQQSVVLLKNDGAVLPLDPGGTRVALIGPLADNRSDLLGTWVTAGQASDVETVLAGTRAYLGPNQLIFERGCSLEGIDDADFAETLAAAVAAARAADVVVAVVGEGAGMSGEAHSRAHLGLPGRQQELVDALAATGKPLVAVVVCGRPLVVPKLAAQAGAVVLAWHGGIRAGRALADVLFGAVNPSGKLCASWPRAEGQMPVYYAHKPTGRPAEGAGTTQYDVPFRSTYMDIPNAPLFAFGQGASYTTFAYRDLRVSTPVVRRDGTLGASVTLQNTGERAGEEVVQLYVRDVVCSVTRPVKELKGFRRVALAPGEEREVVFEIPVQSLGCHGLDLRYTVEPGRFTVWIGPDSITGLQSEFEVVE